MNTELMLAALKVDLGIRSEAYDERLAARLTEAVRDRELVIMYAGWLWRNRIDGSPMPRMLVMARNNRLFGRKAATT